MNHWQTIDDALDKWIDAKSIEYSNGTINRIEMRKAEQQYNAALAFVREMRQQPLVPDDVAETMRAYLMERRKQLFAPGRKWDDATERVLARIDTALEWLDINAPPRVRLTAQPPVATLAAFLWLRRGRRLAPVQVG